MEIPNEPTTTSQPRNRIFKNPPSTEDYRLFKVYDLAQSPKRRVSPANQDIGTGNGME